MTGRERLQTQKKRIPVRLTFVSETCDFSNTTGGGVSEFSLS